MYEGKNEGSYDTRAGGKKCINIEYMNTNTNKICLMSYYKNFVFLLSHKDARGNQRDVWKLCYYNDIMAFLFNLHMYSLILQACNMCSRMPLALILK